MVSELLKELSAKHYYLVLIYDGEYKQFITEILDPYGEIHSAGLAPTLEQCLKEAKDGILTEITLDEE